jgi:hypothetical protein
MVLIELQYLPSLEYFCLLLQEQQVMLEAHEHFVKQSYRSRCYIRGANGVQMLSIPVLKGNSKVHIQEIRVDNSQLWQANHWRSIVSAYGNAPYFEFYRPYLEQHFLKKEDYLWKVNINLLTICLELLSMNTICLSWSETFNKETEGKIKDARSVIHPKKTFETNKIYRPVPYIQVFGKDFVPNLSIIDLLLCQGPESGHILKESCNV